MVTRYLKVANFSFLQLENLGWQPLARSVVVLKLWVRQFSNVRTITFMILSLGTYKFNIYTRHLKEHPWNNGTLINQNTYQIKSQIHITVPHHPHFKTKKPDYSGNSIMRTPLVPSKVSWVERCPYFGGFWYISGGHGNGYSCRWALRRRRSRSPLCCTMARKINQRLELCVPVLV